MSPEAKIITDYDPKPIPDRSYDWSACRDDDDDGETVGYGRTEAEAIADLLELEGCALDEAEARAPFDQVQLKAAE